MELFGINIIEVIMGAGVGALLIAFLDKVYALILMKFFPDKYILKLTKDLDDKYLDEFKKKYPTAGGDAEKKIASTLRQMADIIEDK